MTTTPRTWSYEVIDLERLTAIDLRATVSITAAEGHERLMTGDEMATRGIDAEAYRIDIEGSATRGTALVMVHRGGGATIGMEMGGAAVWVDLFITATADDGRWLDTDAADDVIEAAIAKWLDGAVE